MITEKFDCAVTCGNDYVAVRVLNNAENLKVGNIYVPQMSERNNRLAFCIIENIGKKAAEMTGCKTGDYVMIDRLATFGHTSPVACLKYDSVICLTNEANDEYFPLKDMLFVEPDEKSDMSNVSGVYVVKYDQKLNLGTVAKLGFDASERYPFTVGDKVVLTRGADVVSFGETTIYIYKKDMIVCKIQN